MRLYISFSLRLELVVLCRDLVDEAAAELTAGVAAGTVSPWQLGWRR